VRRPVGRLRVVVYERPRLVRALLRHLLLNLNLLQVKSRLSFEALQQVEFCLLGPQLKLKALERRHCQQQLHNVRIECQVRLEHRLKLVEAGLVGEAQLSEGGDLFLGFLLFGRFGFRCFL